MHRREDFDFVYEHNLLKWSVMAHYYYYFLDEYDCEAFDAVADVVAVVFVVVAPAIAVNVDAVLVAAELNFLNDSNYVNLNLNSYSDAVTDNDNDYVNDGIVVHLRNCEHFVTDWLLLSK